MVAATKPNKTTGEPVVQHPEYISVTKFAKKFGKARSTIHRACDAGRIKFIAFPSAGEKDQKLIPYTEVLRIEDEMKSRK